MGGSAGRKSRLGRSEQELGVESDQCCFILLVETLFPLTIRLLSIVRKRRDMTAANKPFNRDCSHARSVRILLNSSNRLSYPLVDSSFSLSSFRASR